MKAKTRNLAVDGELRSLMNVFFNDTATTEFYTLSLHDALPIYASEGLARATLDLQGLHCVGCVWLIEELLDRKSTRLNSSHLYISYDVFCLKTTKTAHLLEHHVLWSQKNKHLLSKLRPQ